MNDTKGMLKLTYLQGGHHKDITVVGLLDNKKYYCLTVKYNTSKTLFGVKYNVFFNACHASDNSNNHYGLSNGSHNLSEALNKAIKDSKISLILTLNESNYDQGLIEIAKHLNPNLKHFEINED